MLGDRVGEDDVGERVLRGLDAGLELSLEDPQLAAAGRSRPTGWRLGEPVPGPRELEEARPAAAAVGGQHRADPAAPVGVRADDDLLVAHAVEHRSAGRQRQAVDRAAEVVNGGAT